MSEELKACAHCGGHATHLYGRLHMSDPLDAIWHVAQCDVCRARIERETEADLVTAWNTRTSPDAARVEMERVLRAVDDELECQRRLDFEGIGSESCRDRTEDRDGWCCVCRARAALSRTAVPSAREERE